MLCQNEDNLEDKTVIHIDVTPRPQNDREVHQIAKKTPKIVEDFKFTPKEILLEQENYIVTGQCYSEHINFSLCFVRMSLNKILKNECVFIRTKQMYFTLSNNSMY